VWPGGGSCGRGRAITSFRCQKAASALSGAREIEERLNRADGRSLKKWEKARLLELACPSGESPRGRSKKLSGNGKKGTGSDRAKGRAPRKEGKRRKINGKRRGTKSAGEKRARLDLQKSRPRCSKRKESRDSLRPSQGKEKF